jgi:hypothetical protein
MVGVQSVDYAATHVGKKIFLVVAFNRVQSL